MSDSDSEKSIDQLEAFQNANVKPGMFVSGWEDPNDEIFPEKNPRGEQCLRNYSVFVSNCSTFFLFL